MEVLISIGIMAIGLVSVASLLPVGGLQQQKANVEERKAQLVLNAVRDFHVRGMAAVRDPVNFPWLRPGPTAAPYFVPPTGQVKFYQPTNALGVGILALPPVAIDPLMSSVAISSQNAMNSLQYFPRALNGSTFSSTGAFPMPRLALTSLYNTNPTIARTLAEAAMVAHDDVIVNQPDDRTLAGHRRGDQRYQHQSSKTLRARLQRRILLDGHHYPQLSLSAAG